MAGINSPAAKALKKLRKLFTDFKKNGTFLF